MGCTSSHANTQFLNGKPTFKGDEVVKGFEKENGLLFRIVKKGKKKRQTWAFYNDTKQYEMRVHVTFNAGCDIKALGETKLEEVEDKDEVIATVTVQPGATEMFIEGRVNGFRSKMDAFKI
ncbi:putative mitochondrial small myristoylated protein-1, putative (SMP-1) [Leptomonas pyrrhocoris]|uniref:Putative mitochondrial small myristoylated protein-1, putative (SMP-1) n=1 Tax=Leptomonas pyrrhocoris TaxID=157538 RepID=A0A0M9FSP7_LEPPY|nr:putative mitochondrial small myristoylated protein-1, putative (SMP-1) [Leptomonas pyrrhocoris]KPA75243.1 putative mitochondrial small myristoylated protein-1, putative (SMP-1) [Leptomonas pyrrhocoris]|eukprot:XP_015653682.1 putative mitochondrial small myristoylated protein-1, putative (SMP-1) [Leptomonas pyrrhocoris]